MKNYSHETFQMNFCDFDEQFETTVHYYWTIKAGEIVVDKIDLVPFVRVSEPVKQLIQQMCETNAQEIYDQTAEEWRQRKRVN